MNHSSPDNIKWQNICQKPNSKSKPNSLAKPKYTTIQSPNLPITWHKNWAKCGWKLCPVRDERLATCRLSIPWAAMLLRMLLLLRMPPTARRWQLATATAACWLMAGMHMTTTAVTTGWLLLATVVARGEVGGLFAATAFLVSMKGWGAWGWLRRLVAWAGYCSCGRRLLILQNSSFKIEAKKPFRVKTSGTRVKLKTEEIGIFHLFGMGGRKGVFGENK